ncbi:hypothetical protein [Streptomyces luteireticuli]|uniref:hypothetical protein n=1 Tax=Streptomyces luteireticuli TaxID=173858 RepID=UPI0035575C7E
MKSPRDVEKAFAELPQRITTKQIAQATGRTTAGVGNWINNKKLGFPGPSGPPSGRTQLRDRDEVLAWYIKQPFSGTERRGPRDVTAAARSARPERTRLSVAEIAGILQVSPRAVQYHMTPERDTDPFPPADAHGDREWAAVRAWLLRRDAPLPDPTPDGGREWPKVRAWLLAVHDQEQDEDSAPRDEAGLTYGQRDVLERARVALAEGEDVPLQWLAEVTGLDDLGEVERLVREGSWPPGTPDRLRPTALATELGITRHKLRHLAEKHTGSNPFPEPDETGARDTAQVRAWLKRHGMLPDPPEQSS